jgi:hypothetical protein
MAIVAFPSAIAAFRPAGKLGFGRGYGASVYGHMRYGFFDLILGGTIYGNARYGGEKYTGGQGTSGIYQRRMVGPGSTLAPKQKGGRIATSRGNFYGYKITHTIPQQAWRDVFKAGKAQYDLLTTDQKVKLSKQVRSLCMTGYNFFMSSWLQSHRS